MKKLLLMTGILTVGTVSSVLAETPAMDQGQPMNHHAMGGGDMMDKRATGLADGHGVINSVDEENHVINITHDPIPTLHWPAMTMDIPVTKQVDLGRVSSGDKVDFKIMLGSDNVYRIHEIKQAR